MAIKARYICPYFFIVLLACCRTPADKREPCRDKTEAYTRISNADSNIVRSYLYAYGIGRDAQKIFPEYPTVYKYNPVDGSHRAYQDSGDGYLMLYMDPNRNSCGFCLVKRDGSVDTVSFRYNRRFFASKRCDGCEIYNMELADLSAGFRKDSCYIRKDWPGDKAVILEKW